MPMGGFALRMPCEEQELHKFKVPMYRAELYFCPHLGFPLLMRIFHATATTGTTTTTSSSSSSSFQSFPSADFELISIRPTSYTSLKDLLPSAAAVQSPTAPAASQSGYEITIRNRLVKQAAWAYLQPMSTSPDSAGQGFLHRLWVRISGAGLFRFVDRVVTRAFDWMLRVIRVRTSR
ncbi:hypothetical protein RJ639_041679 [Escallonia herrerae]|uniref:Uncharacterized protein n=1 Tax=Escallonia herrerae TaxID=1293975 RepID=A0AA88WEY4_9ASTE|nr:hypothetical protein RJ639_041679 [Escallonia herrerae]